MLDVSSAVELMLLYEMYLEGADSGDRRKVLGIEVLVVMAVMFAERRKAGARCRS